mgnify:CR=1 FL=1|jgi:anti-sigma factor RsiW
MIENEIQLKVQALVDGELTGRKAEELLRLLESNAELKSLHTRLTAVRGLMSGAELPRELPESGDFYWSRIAHEIERKDRETNRLARPASNINWWLRWLIPLAGVACLGLVLSLQPTTIPDLGIMLSGDHELELSDDQIDVITFNSGDDTISVVWLDYSIDLQQDELELWLD